MFVLVYFGTLSSGLLSIAVAAVVGCVHVHRLRTSTANWQSAERAPRVAALQQQLDGLFNLPPGAWDKR